MYCRSSPDGVDARRDPQTTLHQQPSGTGEEPADDRIRDEAREVAQLERAENRNVIAVKAVTTIVVATTVRNARSKLSVGSRAALATTIARTATAASCTLPTTPRAPALHARIASVRAAATR